MFGATGGGFSFGGAAPAAAPAATGGLFGASPAASGGFGAAATPASGGMFGAAAPAAGGGLFGAATPTAAPGGFGAATTPGGFGAPASSPAPGGGLFGAASSSPAPAAGGGLFGASPGGGAAFGAAPSPAAPSLFGAAAPPAGGGLFGAAATPAAAPAGGMFGAATSAPSLFGAASTPAAGGGLFGGAAAGASAFGSTPAAGGGMFGGAAAGGFGAPALTTGGGLFGATPGATPGISTQLAPSTFSSHMPQPEKEVLGILEAYSETNPKYKFRHLLYNVYNDPSQKVKPPDVDEVRWREALEEVGGADNAQRLWPVMARGFKDLKMRLDAQDQALEGDRQLMEYYTREVSGMKRHHEAHTREKVDELRGQHTALKHRLLLLMRRLEALDGTQQHRQGLVAEEARMAARLQALQDELSRPAVALGARLDAVSSQARLARSRGGGIGGGGEGGKAGGGVDLPVSVDEDSLDQMHSVLKQQTDALRHLMEVLKRASASLKIMEEGGGIPREEGGMMHHGGGGGGGGVVGGHHGGAAGYGGWR